MNELATEARKQTFVFGSFRLDVTDRVLRKSGEPLPIRGRALELLIVLLERAGEVVSQKELISKAWHDGIIGPSNLRAHIASLRRTFDPHGDGSRYIATVSGRATASLHLCSPQRTICCDRSVSTRPQANLVNFLRP
ncbi:MULTISPECIES: winged helix-turn-helix domain-containing protein [Bradyrhizobium]|uniref:winged helix-turn-helix domain-containing protein n=1 Tax=Bradyrhizobium TaxID=374 RepID=UPI00130EE2B7|nr:winged helix-turn-helix domain-containing protein [Bradyrhizobium japonicum]MBR0735048.1 winged helix-turn-helix domain-containing protein [Bradyrhizobium japonicum]MBR0916536.1 winged helix-turn-helix domain-containing protein [Bradyrhizobium japonicum]MCD9112688.1 winged helix-turn-helix domain-containing protein [Bradyrhizobium japonicum]MCD9259827.1 winged helix-turn-helix domain-containing protein [Bradyrhizobium japonicum SEMIA 5079]MCD9913044.1 winged helix-turn-helix domain-containi